MPVITIEYAPRPLQKTLHAIIRAHRFSVAVCHRRFGKTVLAVNELIRAAATCTRPRPRFHYIAPTYRQGKAAAWDYLKHYTAPIPGIDKNEAELRVNLPNGGQVQILGADNPDSMRGIYSDGGVFDEYGMQQANVFTEVMRPAMADREGWALFMGTPNGKNQFYDIAEYAKLTPGWGYAVFKASETGILKPQELQAAREIMSGDEYAQEFECSFEAAVKGAIYSAELEAARAGGRVSRVPCDPLLPVDTYWDLGVGDATAIWFSQSLRTGEVRLVDFYEHAGVGLPHYIGVLKARGYVYGEHYAPHDIQVKEFASGRSRLETAAGLGITFRVVPNIGIEDGIHAARMLFPRCWFDAERCKDGIESLQHYRRDYNTRLQEFKAAPVHDWASHAADAFRYLAVQQQDPEPVRPRPSYGALVTGPDAWMA